MKKWGILLALILLIGIAGVAWITSRPEKAIPINGTLSASDAADIKQVVKHDLRRKVFPSFSWKSFKELPANTQNYFSYEILEIDAANDSGKVVAAVRPNPNKTSMQDRLSLYMISKNPSGWKMGKVVSSNGGRSRRTFETLLWMLPGYPTNIPTRSLTVPTPPPPFQHMITAPESMELLKAQRSRAPTNMPPTPFPAAVSNAPGINTTNSGTP